jgi:hypothetical protein
MRFALSTLLLVCATLDLTVAVRWGMRAGASVARESPCRSSLTASAPLPAKVPANGLRLQVCRNDECDVHDLAGTPLAFTRATVCDGDCYVQDGVVQVSRPLPAQLAATDTYDVRLFDPVTQRTYAASHGRMVYIAVTAGAAADPDAREDAGECRAAEVTARPLGAS